jgi:DNA recombination protein RmuC
MDVAILAVGVVALVIGAVVGWLYASRESVGAKQTVDSLRLQLNEVAKERDDARTNCDAASRELATLQADARNFEQRLKDLAESRDALIAQFRAVGDQLLEKAQKDFLEKAGERFSKADAQSEAKLKAVLQPVEATLKRYEEGLQRVEKERVDQYAGLREAVELVRSGQGQVRDETRNLVNALRSSPKARGRWGERALQNVLEQCGLSQHTDFNLEHSIDTEDGRLRPDAVINVPGQKKIVIDAKVSLNAYQEAFEANDEEVRKKALDAHARSMRNHVQTLGAKSYQSQFDDAPDYVVMFVPGEHFVAAALEHDPELWDFAFERRVLLATPTNLVAIARTIAQVWRQDGLAREAQEIGRMGAELYERLAVAADHLKRVGGGLESAVNNYNKFVGSFERNVLSSGKRLAEKGIEIGKREIEAVPLVESAPRYTGGDAEEPASFRLVGGTQTEESGESG